MTRPPQDDGPPGNRQPPGERPLSMTFCQVRPGDRIGMVRVTVTRIDWDGTMRRRMVDTAQRGDGTQWEDLTGRALAILPLYRPVPRAPVYHLRVDDTVVQAAEQDLTGALLDLITAVLALGEDVSLPGATSRHPGHRSLPPPSRPALSGRGSGNIGTREPLPRTCTPFRAVVTVGAPGRAAGPAGRALAHLAAIPAHVGAGAAAVGHHGSSGQPHPTQPAGVQFRRPARCSMLASSHAEPHLLHRTPRCHQAPCTSQPGTRRLAAQPFWQSGTPATGGPA